ncbi:putative amidase [Nymphon striatum]|nr:putative amidase [Nymphon striatum]
MPQVFAVTRQVGADEGHMESADEEGGIQQQVGLGVRGSSELLAQGPLRRVGLRLGEVGASATAKGWSEHDGGKREECKRHHGRLPAPAFDEEAGERHQQELAHRSGCTHNAKCHGSALGADHATHRREHHREARRAHGQAGQETASQDDHEGALGGGEQQQGQGVQQRAASKRDGPAVSIRDSPGERLTQTPHDRLDSDRDTPRALHAVEHRFDDRIKEYAVGRPHAERHRGENATEGDDNRYGIRASCWARRGSWTPRWGLAPARILLEVVRVSWIVGQSIGQLQELMSLGRGTSAQVVEAYLARIAAVDPLLNSVVEVNPEAVAIAASLDDERKQGHVRGPLHGIPILLKENIDTADSMLTTAGSLALVDSMPKQDSTTAARLREAGAVILGKTGMSEWAFFRSTSGTSGWSGRNGQVRNPYDQGRTPSGSSSGSGVAASASLAAATIGTETNGSIVSPANANGVVGLKPTVGLTSRSGVIPISHTQDTIGPLARSVADAAVVLSSLAGPDVADPATQHAVAQDYSTYVDQNGLRGARIGVARSLFGFSRHADQVANDAVALLREAGATTIDVPELRVDGALIDQGREVLLHEFKAGVNDYLAQRTDGSPRTIAEVIAFNEQHAEQELQHFGQELLEMASARGSLTSAVYLEALAQVRRLARDLGIDHTLTTHNVDAIVAPTGAPATPIDLINGDARMGGTSTLAAVAGYPADLGSRRDGVLACRWASRSWARRGASQH